MFTIGAICQACFIIGISFVTTEMELEIKQLKNKKKEDKICLYNFVLNVFHQLIQNIM